MKIASKAFERQASKSKKPVSLILIDIDEKACKKIASKTFEALTVKNFRCCFLFNMFFIENHNSFSNFFSYKFFTINDIKY